MDVLLATNNPGKLREFRELLADLPISVKSPSEIGLAFEVAEDGDTFEANATTKASAWAANAQMICVADDSGLCVDALDGAPGVYSARWSAMHDIQSDNPDQANLDLVVQQLAPHTNRRARYVCVGAIALPDGTVHTARGELAGTIIDQPRGVNGFGYDPVFVPEGETRTAAELSAAEKHKISHRGQAMAELKTYLAKLVG